MLTPIRKNLLASAFGQLTNMSYRFFQVPVFLSGIGVEGYGAWLSLSAIHSMVALSGLGIGTVVNNEVNRRYLSEEFEEARTIYSTSIVVLWAISSVVIVLAAMFVFSYDWSRYFQSSELDVNRVPYAAVFLIIATLLSFQNEVVLAKFRCVQKAHLGILIINIRLWIELGLMLALFTFETRVDYIGGVVLVSAASTLTFTIALSFIINPTIYFSFRSVNFVRTKSILFKGLQFQSFTFSNLLLNQGILVVLQVFVGPAGVALVATTRTLVGVVTQGFNLINQSFLPEINRVIILGDFNRLREIYRKGVFLTVSLGVGGFLFIITFGPTIYSIWTGSRLELYYPLLLVLSFGILLSSSYSLGTVVIWATNQPAGLALRVAGGALLALAAAVPGAYFFQEIGVGAALLLGHTFQLIYALRKAKVIVKGCEQSLKKSW